MVDHPRAAFSSSPPSVPKPILPRSKEQGAAYLHAGEREAAFDGLAFAHLAGVICQSESAQSSSRADFAMRVCAISFLTLARVAAPNSFNLEGRPQFAAHTATAAAGVASVRPGQNGSSD